MAAASPIFPKRSPAAFFWSSTFLSAAIISICNCVRKTDHGIAFTR